MALIAGAAIAGAAAAGSYLDARFCLRGDLHLLYGDWKTQRHFRKSAQGNRISLWYNFEDRIKLLPDSEQAIWSRDGCYTFKEMHAECCKYAQFFLSLGVRPGELVAFYLTNHPEIIIGQVGSWAIGSAPALINYNLSGDTLIHCLKISGSRAIIVDEDEACQARIEESRERIEKELGMTIIILDKAKKEQIRALEPTRPGDEYRDGVKGDFPMSLLYTSGSTGFPKACAFEIQRSFTLGDKRLHSIGLRSGPGGHRWYDCMPLYHGTGNTSAVSCMLSGVTLCIGKKFSTSKFWDDIRDSRADAFVYVGETARYLLNAPSSPKDKEHNVQVMFGNGMRPDVWSRFQERFAIPRVAEFFASTEGIFQLLNVSSGPYRAAAVGYHGLIQQHQYNKIYVPVEVDPETEEIWRNPKTSFAKRMPYDVGGEIIVKVDTEKAFTGYWKNPTATSKKFIRNVFKKGDLYYRTGDALRRTSDGRWYFLDRLGDTFRWKSENVATAEVGETLGHYPGVSEAIVYGVRVPGHDGRAGCAALFLEPSAKASFDFKALHTYLHAKLPKYAVPVFLRIKNELEAMHNNKPNKVPLKKDGIDLVAIEQNRKPGTQADTILWCPEALGNPKASSQTAQPYIEFRLEDMEKLIQAAPLAKI